MFDLTIKMSIAYKFNHTSAHLNQLLLSSKTIFFWPKRIFLLPKLEVSQVWLNKY